MKSVTVENLNSDFSLVADWLAQGEEIELVRRGFPFARLVPLPAKPETARVRIDFEAQMKAIWGDRVISEKEYQEMRDFEHEGCEG